MARTDGAVVYIRVSTEEQALGGVSLDAQDERIRAYCLMAGLQIAELVREEGVSGAKPLAERPGGQQLLGLVSARTVGHIVALKLDRLFRDAADALNQTRSWDKAGVALHLVDMGGQALNTASAMGRMFLTVAAGFAELERNLIAERTLMALRHKKSHRQVYSPTPLGFRREGQILVEESNELAIVGRIRGWKALGKSLHWIAGELNRQQVATKRGGRWHASTIRYVLGNSLYGEAA